MFEYCGSAIRALSMEERMTVCNMSIEAGARAGLVAPDDTTYQYLAGRPFAPKGADWDAAVARWKQLPTDEGATYDKSITIDADALEPMITFGTNPGHGHSDHGARFPIRPAWPIRSSASRSSKALRYMDLKPASRCSAIRSTWCSSEAAPTRACRDLRAAAARAEGPQGESERARDGGARIAGDQAAGRSRRA